MRSIATKLLLLLLIAVPAFAQNNKINLQEQVKGILPFANGGLGTNTNPTAYEVLANCTASTTTPSFCTLVEGNLPATTVFTDQSATFGAHVYNFSAATTFSTPSATDTGGVFSLSNLTLSSITGSTQCLQVNSSGVVSGTTGLCGSPALTATLVGFGSAGNLLTGQSNFNFTAATGNLSLPSLDNFIYVDGIKYTTCQSAVTAAGASGVVIIPTGFAGGCVYTPANGVVVKDYRNSVFSSATPGLFTNAQMNENNLFKLSSCNITTEWQAYAVGLLTTQFATENVTGCTIMPTVASNPVPVSTAVAGYLQNASNPSVPQSGIAGNFQARCVTNNTLCWAGDLAVQDAPGVTGAKLEGLEMDMNLLGSSQATVIGYLASGNFTVQPSSAPAFLVDIPNTGGGSVSPGTGKWTAGFSCEDAATTGTCLQIGRAGLGASSVASQEISLFGTDSGSLLHQGNIYMLPSGSFDISSVAVLGGANSGGIETDVSVVNTSAITDFIATGNFAAQPTTAVAFQVNIPNQSGGTGLWTNGFSTANGSIASGGAAFQVGTLTTGTTSVASQPLRFFSFDGTSTLHTGNIAELPAGQLLMGDGQGTGIAILGASGGYNIHQAQSVNAGVFTTTDPAASGTDMLFTGGFSNNDCVKAAVTSGVVTFVTAGGGNCSGGGGGSGTVTSIGITQTGSFFTITNTPITTAGNINLAITGTLGVPNGGTGATTLTSHGVLIAEGTAAFATSGPNSSTGLPLLSQGLTTDPAFGQLPLTSAVTGILPVANGGTNLAALTAHYTMVGAGTSSVSLVAPGTSGYCYLSNGASSDPSFQACPSAITLQTNGTGNSSAVLLNFITSVTNTDGLTNTPANPSGGQEKFEITGTLNATGGGTGISAPTAHSLLIAEGASAFTLLSCGANTTLLGNAADPTCGTLGVAAGGTGQTTLTNHGVLVGAGTSAITQLAASAAGKALMGQGASSDPSFTPTPTLGIAGTTAGTLGLSGVTSGVVTLATANAAGTWTLTLPTTGGSNGQFLQTNGSGTSTWASPSGSGTVNSCATSNAITEYLSSGTTVDCDASILASAAQLTIGVAGTSTGKLQLTGVTSGTITVQGQSAAGTYNFNLPTSAGTSGQPLLSGGGSSAAMTFGTLSVGGGGTGQTTLTNHGVLVGAATSGITQLAAAAAGTVLTGQGASADPSFTATPVLGVAGTTLGTLGFAGNSSGTVTVESSAAAGTWTLTLPTTGGTAGYFLQTNGSGTTTWAVASNNCSTSGAVAYYASSGLVTSCLASVIESAGQLALGVAGTTAGVLTEAGATNGVVTIQTQAAAGTYNFNLPTGAGTSGQPLLSGGGSGSPMTFGTLGAAAGGTGTSSPTAHDIPIAEGSSAFNFISCGANTALLGAASADPTCGTVPNATLTNSSITISTTAPLAGGGTFALGSSNTLSITGAAGQVLAGSSPAFTATPTLGVNASTTGQVILANGGGSGASVTVQNNSATSAYNFNLPATPGSAGQILTSQGGGSSAMTWSTNTGTPGGLNTQMQYNNTGAFGGTTGLTWNASNSVLTLAPNVMTTDQNPFAITWTYNASGTTFNGHVETLTNTASHSGSLGWQWCVSTTCQTLDTALNLTVPGTITTSGSNGGVTFTEGTGGSLSPSTSVDTLGGFSTQQRLGMNNHNTGWYYLVGMASQATANNCPKFAADGWDLVDSGAGCGGLSGLTTNFVLKATSSTAAGNSSLSDNAVVVSTVEPVLAGTGTIAVVTTQGANQEIDIGSGGGSNNLGGTGNTCVSSSTTLQTCWNGSDILNTYSGVTLASSTGHLGQPIQVGWAAQSAKTTAQAASTLFATGSATTMYRASATVACTTTSAAATVLVTILYTDTSNTAQTIASSVATCTTLGAASVSALNDVSFRAKNGTNIQYSTTIANTPTYDVSVSLEQLGTN